ncbi:MAG: hypothetical protein K8F57_02520, partial [Alphaproteobacteria bacterium]|nr:hypothetical protein [Alphaproteobacteria bacterium]
MSAIKGLLFTAAVTAPLLASVSAEAVVLSQRGTALFGAVGSFTGDFVVDPNTDRVWVSEGFGANGARAFDFSNPDAPVFMGTVAGSGSGAAVNPTTNRFYTIDSFRSPSKIREFDGTANSQTQASIQNSVGCGGALDANKATGAVYATTQCADTLHRYDPTANAITHQVGLGVVGSLVRVNEATGNVYANHGTSTNTKVYNGNDLSLITTLGGVQIRDVNATTNRLYMTDYTNIRILDGSTHGLLGTLLGLGSWQL